MLSLSSNCRIFLEAKELTGSSSQLGQQTKLNEYYFHYLAPLAPNHLYLLVML
jgi:hypothetical protein